MGAHNRCPFCSAMMGKKIGTKPLIKNVEWYNLYRCSECDQSWQSREQIVGRGKEATKQSKSPKPSSVILKPSVASQDGEPKVVRKPGSVQDKRYVAEIQSMSIGALLASGPIWKREPSGGTND